MLDLYKNIKKRRTELKMSQDTLAQKTGYTDRSSIAKIESGSVDLSYDKILLFAQALNIQPGELMGYTSNKPSSETVFSGYSITLSSTEEEILIEYRKSDSYTQDLVQRVLKLNKLAKSEKEN